MECAMHAICKVQPSCAIEFVTYTMHDLLYKIYNLYYECFTQKSTIKFKRLLL